MGEQRSLFYILKNFFKKEIQGHNSRESKETSGGFVKTWQILPKTKCKSLLPSFTKSYQIVTFTEHSTLLSISGNLEPTCDFCKLIDTIYFRPTVITDNILVYKR